MSATDIGSNKSIDALIIKEDIAPLENNYNLYHYDSDKNLIATIQIRNKRFRTLL